jgi:hypothetical protein
LKGVKNSSFLPFIYTATTSGMFPFAEQNYQKLPNITLTFVSNTQFILEEYPKYAKIVVCQPRRLAATGVATRVAEERGEQKPGEESVGYVVRGDSALGNKSRLVFCTTGVLLRQLQNEGALDCITHVVIDEVCKESF